MSASALLDSVKATDKINGIPKPSKVSAPPAETACPLSADLVQIHMDSVSKQVHLPMVKPGQTPMTTDKDGKQTPRLSCELDSAGNVVPFSGPVFTDEAAAQLWELLKPHIEHFAGFSRRRMAECLLIPEAKGEIDDRAKVIHIPKGRFIFQFEGQQNF